MPCSLVGRYHRFMGLQGTTVFYRAKQVQADLLCNNLKVKTSFRNGKSHKIRHRLVSRECVRPTNQFFSTSHSLIPPPPPTVTLLWVKLKSCKHRVVMYRNCRIGAYTAEVTFVEIFIL